MLLFSHKKVTAIQAISIGRRVVPLGLLHVFMSNIAIGPSLGKFRFDPQRLLKVGERFRCGVREFQGDPPIRLHVG
jgi:hypothetical protein